MTEYRLPPPTGKPDPGPGPSTSDSTAAYNSLVDTLQRLARPVAPCAAAATPASASRASAKAAGGSAKKSGAKRGRAAAKGAGEEEGQGAEGASAPRPMQRVFVVVLDEVDRLLRKRDGEEELVRLFQLPTTHGEPCGRGRGREGRAMVL